MSNWPKYKTTILLASVLLLMGLTSAMNIFRPVEEEIPGTTGVHGFLTISNPLKENPSNLRWFQETSMVIQNPTFLMAGGGTDGLSCLH